MGRRRGSDAQEPRERQQGEALLSIRELARYLNVNERTILRLVTEREIPAVRIGSQWRFRKEAVEAWLDDQMLGVSPSRLGNPATAADAPRALRLEDCFAPEQVVASLEASSDIGVIVELAVAANRLGLVRDRIWFIGALVEREAILSSAVGKGVAFPHSTERHPEYVERPFLLLGRSRRGIPFRAPDNLPVHFFFLLGLCHEELHIPWLARLSAMMSSAELFDAMLAAPDAAALSRLLREGERV